MDIAKEFGISSTRKRKRTCTQDFIPIKDIRNGVVITDDNRYIKIMEIIPSEIEMLPYEKQRQCLKAFAGFLRSNDAPTQFQVKCTTRLPQTDDYLKAISKAKSRENNRKLLLSLDNYERYIASEARFNSVDRQYHFIFTYEDRNLFFEEKSESDTIQALNRQSEALERELNITGNRVAHYENEDFELAQFIYNHFNHRTFIRNPFEERVERIMNDVMSVNNITSEDELPPADIRDLLAPRGINTKKSPNYILIDGMYRSHYYVYKDGFPDEMSIDGWLSSLIKYDYGYDVDIFYTKKSAEDIMTSLSLKQQFSSSKLEGRSAFSKDAEEIKNNLEGLSYIRYSLKECNEDLYDMNVLVTIHAYTLKDLIQMENDLLSDMAKKDVRLKPAKRLQEEMFFSTMPLNYISPKIYALSKHNVTTSGVVASYPFTTFNLADKDGIVLGSHVHNKNLLFYNPFAHKYSNSNIGIYGRSGNGKTFTLLSIATRLRYLGTQVFILAPDKQIEFVRPADAVGGLFIDMSQNSTQRINPFEIWELDSPEEKLLGGESYITPLYREDKIENMMTWFTYVIRDMNQVEESKFKKALVNLYERFGITKDNESIYIDPSTKRKKPMPTFADFIEELKKVFSSNDEAISKTRKDGIIAILEDALPYFNGQTNVDLTNKFIVFGLEKVPKRWQGAVMALTTQFIWDIARANRTVRKAIIMDEGWKFLDEQLMADFVVEIFKVIRGFGGSAIFATQSIQDTYKASADAGNAILACCNSNILLGMESKDARMLNEVLQLTDDEVSQIEEFAVGRAILIAGRNHIPIHIEASEYEEKLFETKADNLAKLVEEKRREAENG